MASPPGNTRSASKKRRCGPPCCKYLEENYIPSEEDVQSFYDTNLADQKRLLEEDMGNFSVFARSNLTMYIPAGLRYVHSILIAIPTDARSEILRLRAGSEEDQQKAQELLDAELAKIEARAQECYARLQAGEDFEKLLDEYGDDPGMKQDSLNRESGYILYKKTRATTRISCRPPSRWKKRAMSAR